MCVVVSQDGTSGYVHATGGIGGKGQYGFGILDNDGIRSGISIRLGVGIILTGNVGQYIELRQMLKQRIGVLDGRLGGHGPRFGDPNFEWLNSVLFHIQNVNELIKGLVAHLKESIVILSPSIGKRQLNSMQNIPNGIGFHVNPQLFEFINLAMRIHEKNQQRESMVMMLITTRSTSCGFGGSSNRYVGMRVVENGINRIRSDRIIGAIGHHFHQSLRPYHDA